MTDTTDIKALREASEIGESSDYMTWPKVDPAKLKRVLDQLEAERQRADDLQHADYLTWHASACKNYAENIRLKEENAALKGKQVPVGWEVCSPEWCNKHNACHEAPRIWFESEDGTGPHYHPSEYIAPQKLTDLSYDVLFNAIAKSATPLGEHMSISVKDFKAAIESAGGIVKDGE